MPKLDSAARPPRDYAVFLSYRHEDNKQIGRQWASWLHHSLETYEVPRDLVGTLNSRGEPIPASLYPVFRDEEELPADADLGTNIRTALEHSRLLVVLCSPRAVASRFVAEEIRCFKELGRADRILALIIDGEPNASDDPAKRSASLGAALECLPEPLRFGRPRENGTGGVAAPIDWTQRTEPIAADVRPEGHPDQGWTTAAAYREALGSDLPRAERDRRGRAYDERLHLAVLKIVAGALGVPLGDLTKRDAAYRARKFRRLAGVFGSLFFLALASGGVALWQRGQANQQRRLAEQNAGVAQANAKQAEASALRATEKQREAEESQRAQKAQLKDAARADCNVAQDLIAQGRVRDAMAHLARACEFDPESSVAAEMALYAEPHDQITPPLCILRGQAAIIWSARFSPDGSRIVTDEDQKQTQIWDATSGKPLATLQGHVELIDGAQFSPEGARIITADDKTARVWDAAGGKLQAALQGHKNTVTSAQFSPDGTRIVTASLDQTTRIWDAANGKLLATLQGGQGAVSSADFSPDGTRIMTVDEKATRIWDAVSGKLLATLGSPVGGADHPEFSPDGLRVAATLGAMPFGN